MKTRVAILLSILMIFGVVGCRKGKVESIERNPAGGYDVTVSFAETDINDAIAEALTANGNPLLRDPDVDLQNGQIYVTGEHDKRDGSGRVSGDITIVLSVQNGVLAAQITAVNIEGVTMTDTRIAEFNQRFANGMTLRANRENREITMLSVDTSEDQVLVKFNAKRQD
ncbi:MAG: LmeA family phospholipid-binding protein [Anaerolineales bacterium]|nr:LmeA family phospholipid-binding protein [Anaerolineales bacterium]